MRRSEAASYPPSSPSLIVAAAMLAAPVLFPPEIYPWSLLVCVVLAVSALALITLTPDKRNGGYFNGAVILAPLAVVAILLAPGRARALDEAALFVLLIVAGLLGARLAREPRTVDVVSMTLILVGTLCAVQAILQHYLFYPQQLELLHAGANPDSGSLMVRLAAGRPSGPFILPAVLGTFLAISAPPCVALLLRSRRGAVRIVLIAVLAVQGHALLLTRSFGAILAAGVASLLLLPLMSRSLRRFAAAAIVVALLGGSVYFVHARRAELGSAPGSDPISLRLGNWQTAAGMVGDHPMFGVGPGGFGTSYTLYMRPGMNETRYAHNSYLQIVACWGLWAIVPLAGLLIVSARSIQRLIAARDPRLALAAGAAAFLFHNFIDFGVYLAGFALPAALLLGIVLASAHQHAAPPSIGRGAARTRVAAASLAALFLIAVVVPEARSRAALDAARDASEAGDPERAAVLARHAAEIRPSEPDAWAFLAEMTLVHWRDDTQRRAAGEAAARRAVRLDPESAIRHYTRGLYYLAAGAGAAAYREQAIAHRLFPLKDLYRLPTAPDAGAER